MVKIDLFSVVTTQKITCRVDQDESVEGDKIDDDVGDGDDDDDDEMIGQFSGTSDWWTVGTLLIIAVSLQLPPLPALP